MKTNKIFRLLALLSVLVAPGLMLTSCSDNPTPDPMMIDPRLVGSWELTEANGTAVTGTSSNFFEFESDGTGYYYEYVGGRLQQQEITWYCMPGTTTGSNFLFVTKTAVTGMPQQSQMSYTVTGGTTLTMTWQSGGLQTYIYTKVQALPNA